jgi:pimeloyl-ACP methyl ester carboxylesterase
MPLLEQHLTMVYLDPIGTGRSELLPGGDYSVSTYARFARAVIGHLGAEQPYFLGHSHGGCVGPGPAGLVMFREERRQWSSGGLPPRDGWPSRPNHRVNFTRAGST